MLRKMTKKHRLLAAAALLLATGVGIPLLELWIKCQQPASEGCIWAKAYLPLSFGLWTAAGVIAAVVAWVVLGRRRRRR